MVGDFKFGELKGVDAFGNKYFENREYPFGQHRWVEYADIHNFDPTMIQPEWHGWMHHMYDEVPGETPKHPRKIIPSHNASNAIYDTHVYDPKIPAVIQHNRSQFRQRGWQIGSLQTKGGEADQYYLHVGHPLNPRAYGDDGSRPLRSNGEKTKTEFENHTVPKGFQGPAAKPPKITMDDIRYDV